jgi:hypothetical protein
MRGRCGGTGAGRTGAEELQSAKCRVDSAAWRLPRARSSYWLGLGVACTALVLNAQVLGQGRIANARMETRSAAQGLEREVAGVAARGTSAWVGYSLPIIPGSRPLCSGVMLEPPQELLILARLDRGKVVKLKTLTPNCEVDAGGMAVVWLTDVKPAESVAWLATFVGATTDNRDVMQDLSRPALAAIGLHATDGTPRLIQIVRTTTNRELRKQAMTWLGRSRDPQAVRFFEELLSAK